MGKKASESIDEAAKGVPYVPDAYPLSYQANLPLKCVGVLNSTAIRTMSESSISGCKRRCMARALGRFFSLLRISHGSVGMSCTSISADLNISTSVRYRGDECDDMDDAGQVKVDTAPLLSGSMATSVRLRSGFVTSSGNRQASMLWMAVARDRGVSGALDEAVACEAFRATVHEANCVACEFEFAVAIDRTRAFWRKLGRRWTIPGIHATTIMSQKFKSFDGGGHQPFIFW